MENRQKIPLLLFSVLYSFWVANYVAFDGDAFRELSAQFLALAEKQERNDPAHHRASPYGSLPNAHRGHRGRAVRTMIKQSRFTTPPNIACWRHGLVSRCWSGNGSHRSRALWLLGYPEAALTDAEQALKDAREIGQAATLMYALSHTSYTQIHCGRLRVQTCYSMSLLHWQTKKMRLFWKAARNASARLVVCR